MRLRTFRMLELRVTMEFEDDQVYNVGALNDDVITGAWTRFCPV